MHPNTSGQSFNNTNLTKQTVIVLLGEFADRPFVDDFPTIEADLRSTNGKLGLSVGYFTEASGNKFNLDFVFVQKAVFRTAEDLNYFVTQDNGVAKFCETLIQALKTEIADATQTHHPNSNVENVPLLIIHSAEDTKSGLTSQKYESQEDPKHPYALCSLESLHGTYCHELGHLLFNWPDLYDSYDLDESGNTIDGVTAGLGDWCLMARGIGQYPEKFTGPSGWIKFCQKWLQANDLPDGSHTLRPGEIAKIPIGGSEYLLLENRAKKGIDSEIPKGGLLVYHVDESAPDFHTLFPNHDELYPGIRLYQGDGFGDLNYGAAGDACDPYPSEDTNATPKILNNNLTDYTNPHLHRNGGELSRKRIENISLIQPSNEINFDLKSFSQNVPNSATQIVEVNSAVVTVTGGPGSEAISATKIRSSGQNEDWLVAAELSDILAIYKIDRQGVATRSTTKTKEVFSKDVLLRAFDLNDRNYLLVYDPYNGNIEFFEIQNGILKSINSLDGAASKYRRYMFLAFGEFVLNGYPNMVGLDPFKGILDFYYVDHDTNQNLSLIWLESHEVNHQVAHQARWSSLVSGNFDDATGLDELCFYNLRKYDKPHQHEILIFQTYPLHPSDSEVFDRTQSAVPVRYDHVCSGNFFPPASGNVVDGLAFFASQKGQQEFVFRDTAKPGSKTTVPVSGEWSWVVSGDFLGKGTDQVFLHQR